MYVFCNIWLFAPLNFFSESVNIVLYSILYFYLSIFLTLLYAITSSMFKSMLLNEFYILNEYCCFIQLSQHLNLPIANYIYIHFHPQFSTCSKYSAHLLIFSTPSHNIWPFNFTISSLACSHFLTCFTSFKTSFYFPWNALPKWLSPLPFFSQL